MKPLTHPLLPAARLLALSLALLGVARSETIEYNFDDNDGVVDVNTFGSGVTVSDWTIVNGSGDDFNGSSHGGPTDGMARGAARKDIHGPFTMSFTVTIDAATAIDLTGIAWENGADWNGVTWTPLWDLAITTGSASPSSGGFDSVQSGEGYVFENESLTLSGLTGLTNTAVTFTWDLTQEDRANTLNVIANTMDDVVLTGSASAPPDTDGDGLPDAYEQTIIDHDPGDLVDGLEDVMGTGASPAVTDFDGDDSSDADELAIGTTPTDPDTDDDGFHDGAETGTYPGSIGPFVSYDYGTNTGDTGTDPLENDSDDDTLLDGVESGTGTFVSETNTGSDPTLANSDASIDDTLTDGEEVANGLDPNDDTTPNGDFDDPDMDTIDNLDEIRTYFTHPKLADTDDDDLDDDVEVFTTFTDPLNPDHDGDGLKDGDEDTNGNGVLDGSETDPLDADTDDDGYSDGVEVGAGSDPRLATSIPNFVIFTSNFDANTGAVVLPGNSDNTSGSSTLGVTWRQRTSVTALSNLTAISTGDSGTIGGFVQLQNGTAAFAGPDNAFLSRNHNLDSDRGTSQRGFSLSFTIDSPIDLGTLTVQSGHGQGAGGDQALSSDLVFSLDGGSLAAPVTGSSTENYGTPPAYHTVVFNLGGTSLTAGSYTLDVYQTNMNQGGAYAIFDGISLDDASVLPAPLKVLGAGFNGAAFQVEVTGLDPAKDYVLKHSASLVDGFPTIVDGPRPPAADGTPETDTFSDPSPTGTEGFYRVEEAP